MGRDDPAGGSNLPAPYRSPWNLLAQDLRAALADLRLRLQEGWRRNGEGSLWSPPWWPRDLAPLFWPLLLALALASLLAAGLALGSLLARPAPPAPAPEAAASEAAPEAVPAHPLGLQAETGSEPTVLAPPLPPPPIPPAPEPAPASRPAKPSSADVAAGASRPTPSAAAPDPLVELLQAADAQGLVLQASGQPDAGLVVLELAPGFLTLPVAERQRRAEHWQQLASSLGYEHLELRDRRAGLLGRDALVGAGMILFSTPPPA